MPFILQSFPSPHVFLLTLNRNPVNAFSEAYWRELGKVFASVNEKDDVRVVVLTSSVSKAFSAVSAPENQAFGGTTGASDPARSALPLHQHILDFQRSISEIAHSRVPVIAAIHGLCLGLGVDIASACDIRLAASDAMFSIREVAVAMAADIGSLQRVPKVSGNDSLVREMALTGRFFSADVASKMGLVGRVVDGSRKEVLEQALELAKEIAANSPIAVMGTKHLLDHSRDHTVEEGLSYTALWNSLMLQTDDLPRAIAAFAQRKGGGGGVRFENLGARTSKL